MNWRVMRNLLVLFGAYFVASSLEQILKLTQVLFHIQTGGVGTRGLMWIFVAEALPRMLVAAGATALVWYALGPTLARRWIGTLAALFALFALLGIWQVTTANSKTRTPDLMSMRFVQHAIYALLPAIVCALTGLALHRLAPAGEPAIPDEEPPRRGRTLALVLTWGTLTLVLGAFLGVSIATASIMSSGSWIAQAMQQAGRAQIAYTQYREAQYDEAKQALEGFASYIESLAPADASNAQGERSSMLDAKGLAFDAMVTYGRLAKLAERAQKSDDAARYWTRAEERARLLNWSDTSRDRIRAVVDKLDNERTPGRMAPGPISEPAR